MARPLDPCGTIGARSRHIRNHEPVDAACAQAWRNYKNQALPLQVHVTLPRIADAACATQRGVRLFANIGPDTVPEARTICRACPVQQTCLKWGVLYEDEGMWGGLTREELRHERHKHGIRRQEPYTGWSAPRPAGSSGRKAVAA